VHFEDGEKTFGDFDEKVEGENSSILDFTSRILDLVLHIQAYQFQF
jgi:hypothetical protein